MCICYEYLYDICTNWPRSAYHTGPDKNRSNFIEYVFTEETHFGILFEFQWCVHHLTPVSIGLGNCLALISLSITRTMMTRSTESHFYHHALNAKVPASKHYIPRDIHELKSVINDVWPILSSCNVNDENKNIISTTQTLMTILALPSNLKYKPRLNRQ